MFSGTLCRRRPAKKGCTAGILRALWAEYCEHCEYHEYLEYLEYSAALKSRMQDYVLYETIKTIAETVKARHHSRTL